MNIKSAALNVNFTPYEVFHLLPAGDYPGTLSSNTIALDKNEHEAEIYSVDINDDLVAVMSKGTLTLECDVAIRGTARVILRVTPVFLIVLDENGNQI